MSVFTSLKLQNFRSYEQLDLEGLGVGFIVLSGANGAGKTNILEAVSLLSPGRGLRGAKVIELQRQNSSQPWAVAGALQTRYEEVRLGTGLDTSSKQGAERRTVKINGKVERGQSAFASYLSCVWLTPQMDRLFLDSGRERRLFLDRLVFAFDSGHAGRVTRYENALSQRSKLLREGKGDSVWLNALEAQLAETGVAIAAARIECLERLQKACHTFDNGLFPVARLQVRGTLEELLERTSALEVEDAFKYQLAHSREKDAVVGGAATGCHKSDLNVIYNEKNMPAAHCSTGEQKALLIGIILAHARLLKAEKGTLPILLLDEIAAHLDENRRSALYDILHELGGQCWMTGTDRNLFSAIEKKARFFEVSQGKIQDA